MSAKSDRGGIEIAGADANRMLEVDDEDLAVADPAGSRHRGDGFDAASTKPELTATSTLIFGRKLTVYSAPR
jgi:hypothetical protein